MKDVGHGVDIIFSKYKNIKNAFLEDTEIKRDIVNSLMSMPPVSIYTKTAGTATSRVYCSQSFANEKEEVSA